jgi:cytochrome c oxidase subunit 2
MDTSFQLFPDSASSVSGRVDALYLFLLGVAFFFTLLICTLILFFGVRYRRGSSAGRKLTPANKYIELVWAMAPLGLSMVIFVWGAVIFMDMKRPPAAGIDINVVAKQWMWKIQHPEGKAEINELHIPVGQSIRLKMISEDVIHSFYVPAFRVKQDVLPAYYTTMWFQPTQTGEYHLFCAEYCGTEHSLMKGTVHVMAPDDYADWLSGESAESPVVAGKNLFERFRCATCHKPEGTGNGPSLTGIYGRQVALKSGGKVVADDQYLRDSILNSQKQIVAGYQPLMPDFGNQISEVQALQLIAYLKSLTGDSGAAAGATETP